MTDQDLVEFHRMLTKLAAVLPGAQLTRDVVETYFTSMKAFSLEQARVACQSSAEELAFFPKPVELRSYVPKEVERYDPNAVTYRCLTCYDTALVLTERKDASGQSLGTFGAPCPDCEAGERKRDSWLKPDASGRSFADAAMDNTEALRKKGAI